MITAVCVELLAFETLVLPRGQVCYALFVPILLEGVGDITGPAADVELMVRIRVTIRIPWSMRRRARRKRTKSTTGMTTFSSQ